jgi:hypothetical protein
MISGCVQGEFICRIIAANGNHNADIMVHGAGDRVLDRPFQSVKMNMGVNKHAGV